MRTAALSCTDLRTDGASNAIPTNVTITGDTRSLDTEVQQLLERRIREVSQGVAAAHGATVKVTYPHEFGRTVNDAWCVSIACRAAAPALRENPVDVAAEPVMASEDFGVLGRHVPCLALLGDGAEPAAGGVPLHSRDYVFNDDTLAAGVGYYREVVEESLARD